MIDIRVGGRIFAMALLAGVGAVSASVHADEDANMKPVFDRGSDYDLKHNIPEYKSKDADPKTKEKTAKKKSSQLAHAVAYHVKNLKDQDPELRQSSCEMLGALGAADAVDPLIGMLAPEKKEHANVMMSAHAALVKITGQNFGYKNYDEWVTWWHKNKQEFTEKQLHGPDETAKISAVAFNTIGLEFLKTGAYRAAQQQFLSAVDKDPTIPDYKNNLGLSLLEQGRYLDSMEYFNEASHDDADLPQPYMNIGRCYSRMDRGIEAQTWYKKALAKDKDGRMWDLPWMIGKEYMHRSEWSMAKEYLDQAVNRMSKKGVRDPRVYNDLAITHFGLDQFHSAWRDLMDVRTLGFEPNPEFLARVKKSLADEGIDPEAEDKAARVALHKNYNPEGDDSMDTSSADDSADQPEAPKNAGNSADPSNANGAAAKGVGDMDAGR